MRLSLRDRDAGVSHMTGASCSEVNNSRGRQVCGELASIQLSTEELARDGNENMLLFCFKSKGLHSMPNIEFTLTLSEQQNATD